MTQHRELAVALRRAVFDAIEAGGLVSTGIDQAIEDALILAAAKGGERAASLAGTPAPVLADRVITAAADMVSEIDLHCPRGSQPLCFFDTRDSLAGALRGVWRL